MFDSLMKIYYVYILKCSDETYYTGVTSDLYKRVDEHVRGFHRDSYTFKRRPVHLMYYCTFTNIGFAIDVEKKIKNWSRKKKEALIEGKYDQLPNLAKKKF